MAKSQKSKAPVAEAKNTNAPVADQPKASDASVEVKEPAKASKKSEQPTMRVDEAQAIVNKHESLGGDYEPAELVTARKVLESAQ